MIINKMVQKIKKGKLPLYKAVSARPPVYNAWRVRCNWSHFVTVLTRLLYIVFGQHRTIKGDEDEKI